MLEGLVGYLIDSPHASLCPRQCSQSSTTEVWWPAKKYTRRRVTLDYLPGHPLDLSNHGNVGALREADMNKSL